MVQKSKYKDYRRVQIPSEFEVSFSIRDEIKRGKPPKFTKHSYTAKTVNDVKNILFNILTDHEGIEHINLFMKYEDDEDFELNKTIR